MDILQYILLGIGGTAAFDIWGLALKWTFGIPPSNICLVGRWFCHMPAGRFRHPNINHAAPHRWECAVGWSAHYLIGISLASLFLIVVGPEWRSDPTFAPAILFGIISVLAPFLIMQPAFGLGIAAARSADPAHARLRSILNHAAFGCGLYLTALLLRSIPPR